MIILGINGWIERTHDAAACLVIDGQIVAAVEEERLNRQKHAYDCLPTKAIGWCLHHTNIQPDEIDLIAWGWDLPLVHSQMDQSFNYTTEELNQMIFPTYYWQRSKTIPIEFIPHHLAHAVSAYCCSGFEKSAVLVIDGQGETQSTSIWQAEPGKIKLLKEWPIELSLGYFYEAACKMIGFSRTHAGKLMGLASYANAEHDKDFFIFTLEDYQLALGQPSLDTNQFDAEEELINYWLKIFTDFWGPVNKRQTSYNPFTGNYQQITDVSQKHWQQIAAQIQFELLKVYMWLVNQALELSQLENIVLAGGVALNCSANNSLTFIEGLKNYFIQPAAHDAGVALGAALYCAGIQPSKQEFSVYLGPSYSDQQIYNLLTSSKIEFQEESDLFQVVAKHLEQGEIIGWFQGAAEIGPRALGNRSILADPRGTKIQDQVNLVKGRELWRPLAPSILQSSIKDYFVRGFGSPYMLQSNYIKHDNRSLIPAVTHIDGSARPQSVTQQQNNQLFQLLTEFEKLSNVPLLLNTSFNNEREPIVCTPVDALKTFIEKGLDLLVLGPFVIKKRRN